MHRHRYQGRKLGRERDQRRALMKSMATSLVMHESLATTKPKAKELSPYVERLITKAKNSTLHSRRQIAAAINTDEAAQKLVDDLAVRFKNRAGGYVRIEDKGFRAGDDARLATISFTEKPLPKAKKTEDELQKKTVVKNKAKTAKPKAKLATKKTTGAKK